LGKKEEDDESEDMDIVKRKRKIVKTSEVEADEDMAKDKKPATSEKSEDDYDLF
jgi:hypothetical protein